MFTITKIIAGVIVFIILYNWLGSWVLLPLGILIILVLIRWIADIYWWGKNKGQW
jgi:hypothetical protein